MKKIYIAVIARFDEYGKITPLQILWQDGRKFEITHIHEIIRTASTKAGGTGYRYTVTINRQQKYIWLEDVIFNKTIGARWFVESV